MDNRKPVDQKQKADEQAALMEAQQPGRDDAAQNDPAYYRSQKEVDAAFARRLAAARRKWSRDGSQSASQPGPPTMAMPAPAGLAAQPQAPAMLPQMAAQAQGLPQAAQQMPGMGLNPGAMGQAAPGLMPQMAMGQLPENPMGEAVGQGPQANPMAPGMAAAPGGMDPNGLGMAGADGLNRMALKLLAEEADIQQVFPGFDLESFLASDEGVRDALLQGRSLWSVFACVYGGMVRQQAEAEALERVRSRNDAVPDVLRAGGAAGAAAPDYAGMPSDQFNRLRKQYEEQIRMGKRIKP